MNDNESGMIHSIDHVNLIVDDLDRMIAFYRDVFEFKLTKRVSIHGAWLEVLTGYDDVAAEAAYLEAPKGPGIELVHYVVPESPARLAGLGDPIVRGMRHIAFRVEDVDETKARLEELGVRFLSESQSAPAQQVKYSVRKKLVYCVDPEGNLLELCSYRDAPDVESDQAR